MEILLPDSQASYQQWKAPQRARSHCHRTASRETTYRIHKLLKTFNTMLSFWVWDPKVKMIFSSPVYLLKIFRMNSWVVNENESHSLYPFFSWGILCFQCLAITNKAALNIVEQVSLWDGTASFGHTARNGTAGPWALTISSFLRNCQINVQSGGTTLHSQPHNLQPTIFSA